MVNVSQSNVTDEWSNQNLVRISITSIVSTVPSFFFLYINGIMLYVLRSKAVFRETCRYILLYNLLLADTIQLSQSQVMFLLSVTRTKLPISLCIVLSMLANLTTGISPLTLVVMPLERYITVCYPLRSASIITIHSTKTTIVAIWAICSLNYLIRCLLFLQFPFGEMKTNDLCSNFALLLGALTGEYDRAYTCVLFVTAGLAVTIAYCGVILAARSASTDKVLVHKARNTLLLHLIQLGLSLSSTINIPLVTALSQILTKESLLWIQSIFYVAFIIFPRCLTSLIYGLRDQTIRPVLVYHLFFGVKVKLAQR